MKILLVVLAFLLVGCSPELGTSPEESIMRRFEVTGIFVGECEPITLFNACSFRMSVETVNDRRFEPGRDYIFTSKDTNMEEIQAGERVWISCVRYDATRYRCDFRDFQ